MTSSQLASVGVDVGKSCFHVVGLNQQGAIALRGKHTRGGILAALVQCDAQRFAFEACGGAHDLARRLSAEGREVRLLVPADVRFSSCNRRQPPLTSLKQPAVLPGKPCPCSPTHQTPAPAQPCAPRWW